MRQTLTSSDSQRGWAVSSLLDKAAFVALLVLAVVFPFERVQPLARVGGLAFTTVEVVLLLALALWAAAWLSARRRPAVPAGLAVPALLWLAVMLASALLAPHHQVDALKFTVRTAFGLAAGWAAFDQVTVSQQPGRRRLLLGQALAVGGMLAALLGLAELAQWPWAANWLAGFKLAPTRVGDLLRISGTLGYATTAAMVLELTAPLALAWLLTERRAWLRVALAAALLAQLSALVLTLTRGGVVALLAGFGAMAVLAWRHRQVRSGAGSLAASGVLLALVGLLFVLNPAATLRLRSESEAGWYQAAYGAPREVTATAGSTVPVPIRLTNTGVRTWQPGGNQPFLLSYHLRRGDGEMLAYDGMRTALPGAIAPGQTVTMTARMRAPATAGQFSIEWDMLQEGVTWFSVKGAQPGRSLLAVTPRAGASAAPAAAPTTRAPETRLAPVGRLELWRTAVKMAAARPVLGVGPDNFRHVYGLYAGTATWDPTVHTNNLYVEWLADTGIAGLIVFLWLNVRLVVGALRNTRDRNRVAGANPSRAPETYYTWQLALIAALVAWYVHGLLDSFYEFTPTFVAFWLIAGLALSQPGQRE